MSRSTVRHAVATYLQAQNLPGVGTVYAAPPKITTSGDAYNNLPTGTASAAVVMVEVFKSTEIRQGLGGPTAGLKRITYDTRLHLLARSAQPKAEDAADDHDTTVEAILAAIRADRTLGTNGSPVFQAGEGPTGISVDSSMPVIVGNGATFIWTALDFEVWEEITA